MALLRQRNAGGVKICEGAAGVLQWLGGVHPAPDWSTLWTRWMARGLGVLLILLTLFFFLGERVSGGGMASLLVMDLCEGCLSVSLLMSLIGTVVAWRWEGIGALLIVGSTLLFQSVDAITSGYWQFGPLDPLFYLVGLLFLWTWWRTSSSDPGEAAPAAV